MGTEDASVVIGQLVNIIFKALNGEVLAHEFWQFSTQHCFSEYENDEERYGEIVALDLHTTDDDAVRSSTWNSVIAEAPSSTQKFLKDFVSSFSLTAAFGSTPPTSGSMLIKVNLFYGDEVILIHGSAKVSLSKTQLVFSSTRADTISGNLNGSAMNFIEEFVSENYQILLT